MGRCIHQIVMAMVATMMSASASKLPQPHNSQRRFFGAGFGGLPAGGSEGGVASGFMAQNLSRVVKRRKVATGLAIRDLIRRFYFEMFPAFGEAAG